MQIDFYTNFYKKNNSTLQPTVGGVGNITELHSVSGHLKEPSSVLNPVVQLQNTPVTSHIPAVCTYAYIAQFERYYFITDWTWVDGLWECSMKVDVLATYKTEIGDAMEYVLRTDSTSDYNPYISDTMYPATTNFSVTDNAIQSVFTSDPASGCYVVGIISGNDTNAVGAISYYALTSAEFGDLKEMLFSQQNLINMGIINGQGESITDLSQEVLKALYNPYQYIVSCMWFPFPVSGIPAAGKTTVSSIKIGWWSYTLSGTLIKAQTLEFGESASLPQHPEAATRGWYLNYSPYTRRTLVGRFGSVPIDTMYYKAGDNVSIGYVVDLITGQCRATIEVYVTGETPRHTVVAERYFLLAVPIQLAQIATDYLGVAVSAIGTVKSGLSGAIAGALTGGAAGALTGAVVSAASGIYNTIDSAMPQMATSGANGSFIAPATLTHVISEFFQIADENIHHKGRPLCAIRQISTLSGYIMCADADLDLNCYDSERTEIGNYLVSGFYWE